MSQVSAQCFWRHLCTFCSFLDTGCNLQDKLVCLSDNLITKSEFKPLNLCTTFIFDTETLVKVSLPIQLCAYFIFLNACVTICCFLVSFIVLRKITIIFF